MTTATLNTSERPGGPLVVSLAGDWLLSTALPSPSAVLERLANTPAPAAVFFETEGLGDWDTGLITMLVAIRRRAESSSVPIDDSGLPEGVRKLITLAFTVKEREGARRRRRRKRFLAHLGEETLAFVENGRRVFSFTGEFVMSLARVSRGRGTFLRSNLMQYIQEAGAEALPIVSLIGFLIGMIFAFVGVMQLNAFGAGIYTANLVAVGMIREIAAIMTAIVLAGRTGAAYAAEIGTMKVNEEIDALTTLGVNPVDFLVTPRVIALTIMMPLLTMYASLMGIAGGAAVGLVMLDVSLVQYVVQTTGAVGLNSLFGGLFKSVVYGALVALAGCMQGLACGTSAMAVGQATTRAVVSGIVLIVVSASVLTVIYINLGI